MARPIHKLTDRTIRAATGPGRLGDGGGLYLRIGSGGTKSWSFMWNHNKKRDEIGLGGYPDRSLSSARDVAAQMRKVAMEMGNPRTVLAVDAPQAPNFADCAEQFVSSMESQWRNSKHRAQWRMTLGPAYCQQLLDLPIDEITTSDILGVLEPIWISKSETASRLRGRIERVLNFAKVKGWREGENPAMWRGNLENVLPKRQKLARGHHAALPYADVPQFMKRLQAHEAIAARALEFLILTASRSREVFACWTERYLCSAHRAASKVNR